MNIATSNRNIEEEIRSNNEESIQSISEDIYKIFISRGYSNCKSDQWVKPLRMFLRDNSDKSPEELYEMAMELSTGVMYVAKLMVDRVRYDLFDTCPILLAAFVAYNWQDGRVGLQFLPDPAKTEPDDYYADVWDLLEILDASKPTCILTEQDRSFYDSLPEKFVAYRGCHSVSVDQAGSGVCWTTDRKIAEWFAGRGSGVEPVVVSAWVRKADVRLAFAIEHEVVVAPRRVRKLKYTPRSRQWRPVFGWGELRSEAARTASSAGVAHEGLSA